MYKYLTFSIALGFISFVVGIAIEAVLRKTDFYNRNLSNLNFIKSERLNKFLGMRIFKWIVKNTFFKFLNQSLKLQSKIEKADLSILRYEMTKSEIGHLIGFIFVVIFAVIKFYNNQILFGLTIMVVNVLMNLYPSLLQQENKRRIDKLVKRL